MQAAASRSPSGRLYDGVLLILRPNGFVSLLSRRFPFTKKGAWLRIIFRVVMMTHTHTSCCTISRSSNIILTLLVKKKTAQSGIDGSVGIDGPVASPNIDLNSPVVLSSGYQSEIYSQNHFYSKTQAVDKKRVSERHQTSCMCGRFSQFNKQRRNQVTKCSNGILSQVTTCPWSVRRSRCERRALCLFHQ